MTGIAGLNFVTDITKILNDNWKAGVGGKKPNITAQWGVKATGHATNRYREIIISLDSENPQIFSLLQGTLNTDAYDWLHDVSISLDIRSGQSEADILQMVNETVRILKSNSVPTVASKDGNRTYLQVLPEGITSLNEEYRNMYRYMVSVSCLIFNP